MDWLFGKRKSPAELLRENKRMLDRAIRDIDRERQGLQNQVRGALEEGARRRRMGRAGGGGRCCSHQGPAQL